MTTDNSKMPIILIGNSFKYEIEATLKLFFNTARYSFSNDRNDAVGNDYVIAEVNGDTISAEVKLGSEAPVKSELITDESQDKEHEMCRLIYHILSEKTGITPPWGLMTGIRPVKKVIELIRQELPKEKIFSSLRDKYEVTDKKLQLAYDTAVNQLPILDRIDS